MHSSLPGFSLSPPASSSKTTDKQQTESSHPLGQSTSSSAADTPETMDEPDSGADDGSPQNPADLVASIEAGVPSFVEEDNSESDNDHDDGSAWAMTTETPDDPHVPLDLTNPETLTRVLSLLQAGWVIGRGRGPRNHDFCLWCRGPINGEETMIFTHVGAKDGCGNSWPAPCLLDSIKLDIDSVSFPSDFADTRQILTFPCIEISETQMCYVRGTVLQIGSGLRCFRLLHHSC
jgi:hypothetical protein